MTHAHDDASTLSSTTSPYARSTFRTVSSGVRRGDVAYMLVAQPRWLHTDSQLVLGTPFATLPAVCSLGPRLLQHGDEVRDGVTRRYRASSTNDVAPHRHFLTLQSHPLAPARSIGWATEIDTDFGRYSRL